MLPKKLYNNDYMCVCVCVEREREKESFKSPFLPSTHKFVRYPAPKNSMEPL